jgi:catechol 2,3-dioxygenase-like lactoylglutathione lyase family enzyme
VPCADGGIVLTHFIVSNDIERSRRFYTYVLGGELVLEGEPSIVALANEQRRRHARPDGRLDDRIL